MDQPGAIQEIADLLETTGRFDRNYGTALNHAAEIVVDYEATAGRRLDEEMIERIRSDYGGTPKK